jgi:hypothetical protein
MADPKLNTYIQDALKNGFNKKQIAAKLKSAGYTDGQIKAAIPAAKGASQENRRLSGSPALRIFFGVCIGLAVVLVILLLVYTFILKPSFVLGFQPFSVVDDTPCLSAKSYEEYKVCWKAIPPTRISTLADCAQLTKPDFRAFCEAVVNGRDSDCASTPDPSYCSYIQTLDRQTSLRCLALNGVYLKNWCFGNIQSESRLSMYGRYFFIFG